MRRYVMLVNAECGSHVGRVGREIELPDDLAERWLGFGFIRTADTEAPERAVQAADEDATQAEPETRG